MKRFYSILLLIAFLSACKKEKINEPTGPYVPIEIPCRLTNNIDSIKMFIQSTWEWKQEKIFNWDSLRFDYHTPQNLGYTMTLVLDKSGNAQYFRNNKPDSAYTYKVQLMKEIWQSNLPGDEESELVFYNTYNGLRDEFVSLSCCADYLVLHYDCCSDVRGQFIFKKKN